MEGVKRVLRVLKHLILGLHLRQADERDIRSARHGRGDKPGIDRLIVWTS